MRAPLTLALLCTVSAALLAQTSPHADTLAEARRLRDDGEFAAAAALLRPYVESHPESPGAARFAALMAYWAKQPAVAESLYAKAFEADSADIDLRLEYGRFLLEIGSSDRSREVLAPIVSKDSSQATRTQLARAHSLLGTASYWSGDFSAARRELRIALALDSSVADARRQLREIEVATAASVKVGSQLWDDDQPLRYASFEAEGGWFATPLTPIAVRARSTHFDRNGITASMLAEEVGFASYLAGAHLELGAAGGAIQRSFGTSADWTGRFTLGARLPRGVVLRAKGERAPYTSTARSVETDVMVNTVEGGVRWGSMRGWMGEATARRESYPDDNGVSTAFAWVLAPLSRREAAGVRVGYGFSAQSADESRFVPRDDIAVIPGQGQGPKDVLGEYNPYYTPRNLRVHSALVTARLHPNSRVTFDASGRVGVSARDEAPLLTSVFMPPNVTVTRTFFERSFTPWNARGSLEVAATPAVRLALGVEHGKEAYYSFTTARVQLTYTFIAAALARADVH